MRFAGVSVDNLVVTPAESLHGAIARRTFGFVGPLGRPARFVHDHITRAAYGLVRRSAQATTAVISSAARIATGDDSPVLSRTPRGRAVVAALNALAGDLLEKQGNDLAIPMSLSVPHKPTRKIAVFLHGLGETPESWTRGPRRSFGSRLRSDFAMTPIYVRYNTGLRIADNGARLSELLEALVKRWPVAVNEIVLVGHSMGGLVARAACDRGAAGGARWTSKVRHLVALGAPHTGVPLEKMIHAWARTLRAVPESRPLADILDLRSAGIRDLRHGYVTPRVTGLTYTFISASVHRSPRHPLSWIAGDLLVRSSSATGRTGDGAVVVESDNVYHLAPLTHFDLLDHPEVYHRIREVLSAD